MEFRHECKHFINLSDLVTLRMRLSAIMPRDPNAGPDGSYTIRSLYFDDLSDTALREKQDGVCVRDKYRIRYYNGDTSLIHLEKKSKRADLTAKRMTEIAADNVRRILRNDTAWMAQSRDALTVEFHTALARGLIARAVVEYTREPFVFDAGNVRVTLDHDIRTGMELSRFLEADCVTAPAAGDTAILEVKWDEFLPSVIRDAVQLGSRRTEAFSKYEVCRMFNY